MSSFFVSFMTRKTDDETVRCRSISKDVAVSPAGTALTESTATRSSCSSNASSPADSTCSSSRPDVEQPSHQASTREADAVTSSSKADAATQIPYSFDDLPLVESFYDLADLQDSDPETLKLILRAVNMMRACGYHMQDVCCVLAHASVYYQDFTAKATKMSRLEAGRMAALFMYLAHTYVQDEHCPVKYWHQYLFSDYCDVKTLDRAVLTTLKLRGYTLRADPVEIKRRTSDMYNRRAKK